MRKIVLLLASAALLGVLAVWDVSASTPRQAEALTAKPNFVFILVDDMRKDDLKYMPKTGSVLKDKGMSFENAFVSHAVCCPSRATIMRGQYAHNTGVWDLDGPDGGWQAYKDNGLEQDNVATRLDAAGYRTGLFGKYLNGYDGSTVPVGWDHWFGGVMSGDEYYNYDVNDNGTLRHFGTNASDYSTDVISTRTNTFISNSASLDNPFFAYVAPIAPHFPETSAPRDEHTYDGVKAPRPPSFNERDVSDKPPWIRQLPRFTADRIAAIDKLHERRVEALQAVDDLVGGVANTLNNAGAMHNTYIFFTSDNGYHLGEHRIPHAKWRPYEEDVRMPLLVRGPEVRAGSTTHKLTLNTDYMPTLTDLACPSSSPCETQNWSYVPDYVPDGRPLGPVLKENATTWREAILLEAAPKHSPAYAGIRTVSTSTITKRKYVEYEGSQREFYELEVDPYELTNRYNANIPPATLVSRLQALKTCKADTCRKVEDGQQ
jgi:N-acetylglucosamine-6-sulfatase